MEMSVSELLNDTVATERNSASGGANLSGQLHVLQQKLHQNSHADLHAVRIAEQDGIIRLYGKVCTFYAKQWAQILIGREQQTARIENSIEVA